MSKKLFLIAYEPIIEKITTAASTIDVFILSKYEYAFIPRYPTKSKIICATIAIVKIP